MQLSFTQQSLTDYSRRHLLGPQVEGAGDDGRVWRGIHTHRPLEQGIGTSRKRQCKEKC
jgi:hypothetical protein